MEPAAKQSSLNKENPPASPPHYSLVYIGTNIESDDHDGIFLYRLNTSTGELTFLSSTRAGTKPSYLAISSNRLYLYNVNKDDGGTVRAYSIDQKNGHLTFLNQQPCPGGPTHISLDHTNKVALIANYQEGSIAAFHLETSGHLGQISDKTQHQGSSVNKDRQEGPHAHYITVDPQNRYVLAVDLGIDRILGYRLDCEKGLMLPNHPTAAFVSHPGAGPRHLEFHPNRKFAYLINELDSTITGLKYDENTGVFTEIETVSTLPQDFKEFNKCAAIHLTPNGKYLYGSNRGHDSIAVYSVDGETGKLKLVEIVGSGGKEPRDFTVDLSGKFVLVGNEKSNTVVVYSINQESGRLTETGHKVEVQKPVCLKVIEDFVN